MAQNHDTKQAVEQQKRLKNILKNQAKPSVGTSSQRYYLTLYFLVNIFFCQRLIQRFHHLRTRKLFRNNCIDRSINRIAHNMVPNNVEEFEVMELRDQNLAEKSLTKKDKVKTFFCS